jgi:hypothetical protein
METIIWLVQLENEVGDPVVDLIMPEALVETGFEAQPVRAIEFVDHNYISHIVPMIITK